MTIRDALLLVLAILYAATILGLWHWDRRRNSRREFLRILASDAAALFKNNPEIYSIEIEIEGNVYQVTVYPKGE